METNPHHHPWLLVSHGINHSKQSFYSVSDERFHTRHVPELSDNCVFASAYGWLGTMDLLTGEYSLWNPVSMDKIHLPLLQQPSIYGKCILSKPPNEPNCHVLLISKDLKHHAFCQVGDEEFVQQPLQDIYFFDAFSIQGKIYGLTQPRRSLDPCIEIVQVNFVGNNLEFSSVMMCINQPSRPWVVHQDNYSIQSPCGELLIVHKMYHNNYDFRVFRVDIDRKEWIRLDNIGNRAIFLSYMGGRFCCHSSQGIKSNCIYYTKLMSRYLYIYDLDDRSTTSLLPYTCASTKPFHTQTCFVPHECFTV